MEPGKPLHFSPGREDKCSPRENRSIWRAGKGARTRSNGCLECKRRRSRSLETLSAFQRTALSSQRFTASCSLQAAAAGFAATCTLLLCGLCRRELDMQAPPAYASARAHAFRQQTEAELPLHWAVLHLFPTFDRGFAGVEITAKTAG